MDKINIYSEKLKVIAEQLAYIAFTEDAVDFMGDKEFIDKTKEQINKLNTTLFFSNYEKDEGLKTELLIRVTMFLDSDNDSQISFVYTNEIIKRAIIDKIYNPEFNKGYVQYHDFSFNKPNDLRLYDAHYVIRNRLGLEDSW